MTEMDTKLVEEAKKVREFAHSPYSKIKIGAAVLAQSGEIYRGCNIENTVYSLTNCAERTAIFNALAAGEDQLTTLAIVSDTARPIPPCGACRQVMAEFHIQRVIMANLAGDMKEMELPDLLPYSFAAQNL